MDACSPIGVAESVLRHWVQQLHQERQGRTPHGPAIITEQRRIQELKAQVKRLEREKAI